MEEKNEKDIFNVYGDKLQNFAHNKQTIFLHEVKIYVYHFYTLHLSADIHKQIKNIKSLT